VRRAEAALKDPLALLVLPGAAGCGLATAEVRAGGRGASRGGRVAREGRGGGEGKHAEFHAEYALDCADPTRIDAITFAFFEKF
jgi:hypothetical protein